MGCYIDGKIFACGGMMDPSSRCGYGIEQFDLTDSCEMLDLTSGEPKWHAFPKLNRARFGLQLLPVDMGEAKFLLAIGGRGPHPMAEYSVEALDLGSSDPKWVIMDDVQLRAPRIDFAAALVKESASCAASGGTCGTDVIARTGQDIVILGGNRVTREQETDSSRTWEILRLSLAQDGRIRASVIPGGRLPSSRVGCRATVLEQLVTGKQHLVVAGGFKAWGEGQTAYGGHLDQSVAVLEINADDTSDSSAGAPGTWVDFSDDQLGAEIQKLPLKLHAPAVCVASSQL